MEIMSGKKEVQFVYQAKLINVLDQTVKRIESGDVEQSLSDLRMELNVIRNSVSLEEWKLVVIEYCQKHPLFHLFLQDPFTRRALEKPRGYTGDSVMMDFIYALENKEIASTFQAQMAQETELGLQIHDIHMKVPEARGIRARCRIFAEKMDELARQVERPHILSVASGHLREAKVAKVVQEGRFSRFIALDMDAESLACVEESVGRYGVTTMHLHIKEILRKNVQLAGFDMIYSAGLFDYLDEATAKKLTADLFGMLNPGGRLIISNFLPDLNFVGFIEAFMQWWMVYRSREKIVELGEYIAVEQIHSTEVYTDGVDSFVFVEWKKQL